MKGKVKMKLKESQYGFSSRRGTDDAPYPLWVSVILSVISGGRCACVMILLMMSTMIGIWHMMMMMMYFYHVIDIGKEQTIYII